MFIQNFEQYEDHVDSNVKGAAPGILAAAE
jgi:phosphoenolpyruvate carboxykinase (ATP)